MQYSNFKDTLQNIASQIGNVEQEVDEHKYVLSGSVFSFLGVLLPPTTSNLKFNIGILVFKRRSLTALANDRFEITP